MKKGHLIALADCLKMVRIRILGGTFNVYDPERKTVTVDCAMEAITEALGNFCAANNPRFNRQRWLDYIAGNEDGE